MQDLGCFLDNSCKNLGELLQDLARICKNLGWLLHIITHSSQESCMYLGRFLQDSWIILARTLQGSCKTLAWIILAISYKNLAILLDIHSKNLARILPWLSQDSCKVLLFRKSSGFLAQVAIKRYCKHITYVLYMWFWFFFVKIVCNNIYSRANWFSLAIAI